jgi:putative acyl-CoA dehydrogenase
VQCLDVLRTISKTPQAVDVFFQEVNKARGADARLDRWSEALREDFADPTEIEYRARHIVDRMALALQGALLLQHVPNGIADAFCASRLADSGHRNYGTLPRGVDCAAIIERATPTS